MNCIFDTFLLHATLGSQQVCTTVTLYPTQAQLRTRLVCIVFEGSHKILSLSSWAPTLFSFSLSLWFATDRVSARIFTCKPFFLLFSNDQMRQIHYFRKAPVLCLSLSLSLFPVRSLPRELRFAIFSRAISSV